MAKSDITKLGQDVAWQDVTRGNTIVGCGTTKEFMKKNVNSVSYAFRFARTVVFR